MNSNRKLKLEGKLRQFKWNQEIVPELRLSGKWLAALGFKPGSSVNIKQKPNKLTITLVKQVKATEKY